MRGGQNVIDMTGRKIGQLTVDRRATADEHVSRRSLAFWVCSCVCGKTCVVTGSDLRQGKQKTCGCRTCMVSRRNFQGYGEIGKSHWRVAVQNAEQRGYEFSITIEFMWALFIKQDRKCALSGFPLIMLGKRRTASIDRIDNSIGYVPSNVQWVHKDVNRLKGTFTVDRLLSLCTAISQKASKT